MIRRWYPWLMVLVAMVLLAACGGRTETPASPLATQSPLTAPSPLPTPAADGATLLQERCTACHTLDRVESARKTAEEWERTVVRMIGRGAKLTEAERAVLVEYLAEHYR
ncbi:MAG: hypothetical protein H5T61_15040 [Thermoflexales bacterium]|nr:hypothetical protein [Thermoflexales bacterium]